MLIRSPFVSILLIATLFPVPTHGQVHEETDTETVNLKIRSPQRPLNRELAGVATLVIQETNTFRKQEGLADVEVNPKLMATAQYFADYMAANDKYGHLADSKRPAERALEHGYKYCLVSENIAYQYNSADFTAEDLSNKLFTGWKQSPGHRKNMLEAAATETGVGIAQSEATDHYYAVQMFGRPESARIEFQVINQAGVDLEYQIGEQTFLLSALVTRTHQQCRPASLTFRWPDDAGQPADSIKVNGREILVVVLESDLFKIERQEMPTSEPGK